jgi:hypothetical protein
MSALSAPTIRIAVDEKRRRVRDEPVTVSGTDLLRQAERDAVARGVQSGRSIDELRDGRCAGQ